MHELKPYTNLSNAHSKCMHVQCGGILNLVFSDYLRNVMCTFQYRLLATELQHLFTC